VAISLKKGQEISIDKVAPTLAGAFIGLGWDVKTVDTGSDFDLDSSVFLLGSNNKLISDDHLIFYNNTTSPDPEQAVKHMGDNRTGIGEGDDEVITINLKKLPPEVQKVVVSVSIHEAEERKQNFGQVKNAFVRLVDIQSKDVVVRYDLEEDFSIETSLIMAEIYRKDSEWFLNAVGQAFKGGLAGLLEKFS